MSEKLKKYFRGDSIIWAILIALSILSLLAVYSSTFTLAYKYRAGNIGYYLVKHVLFIFFGFSIVYITHLIPYIYYSRISQLLLIISVPLLIITMFFGTSINEASRWLTLPGTGITFQTSDLAKLALIMYVARLLSLKQGNIRSYKDAFLPIILPVLLICALIMPANLSTAVLLFMVSVILMFIGRIRFTYIALVVGGIMIILSIVITIAVKSEWEGRWETWYNRVIHHMEQDSEGNYQSEQSKIAIVNGGLFGKGPGNSMQRNFLPQPYSDFIFAIIVEEYGLLGGVFVILIYLALLFRAGMLVRNSTRTFPAFLAFGLALMLVLQAMVNISVAAGLIPVTGQPLPMISMGGTSVLFTSAAIGIILSVSSGINRQKREAALANVS
ncbi:MAG: FtsW/RodA/SpoVE family cell cycle protein [Bacteroidales bacterium]|nr:FtsW/RodA/SpoVE family cell cycle protein [Bacteroidales bacterium]